MTVRIYSSPVQVNPIENQWESGAGVAVNDLLAGGFGGTTYTLDLWFVNMDTSYTTGPTEDLQFVNGLYSTWTVPTNPQGTYQIWVGYAPWEPSLNLNFVNQIYQQQV